MLKKQEGWTRCVEMPAMDIALLIGRRQGKNRNEAFQKKGRSRKLQLKLEGQ